MLNDEPADSVLCAGSKFGKNVAPKQANLRLLANLPDRFSLRPVLARFGGEHLSLVPFVRGVWERSYAPTGTHGACVSTFVPVKTHVNFAGHSCAREHSR